MDKNSVPLISLAAGVVLMLLSFAWPRIFALENSWSEEDGQELATASAQLHDLQHKRLSEYIKSGGAIPSGQPTKLPDSVDVAKARKRYEDQAANLNAVRNGQEWTVGFLRWGGVVLALAGVAGILMRRMSDE